MATTIRRSARQETRRALRWAALVAIEMVHAAQGKRDPLVPPTRLMFDGPAHLDVFLKNGEDYFRHFRDLLGLKPDDAVLDIGCGIGRKARLLTSYLSESGRYVGVDPTRKGVDWCARHITPRFPNFRYQHIDVYNEHYNPGGRHRAEEFVFPFADRSFDAVFLGSVFTHMTASEVDHYLAEISRMLRTSGNALITYFLLNDESRSLIGAGKAMYTFKHDRGDYSIENEADPEAAVAFDESFVRGLYASNGLAIREPIRFGSWCGRPDALDHQDIVIGGLSR